MAPWKCSMQSSLKCFLLLVVSVSIPAIQSATVDLMTTGAVGSEAAELDMPDHVFKGERRELGADAFAKKKSPPPPPKKKSPPPPPKKKSPPPPPKKKSPPPPPKKKSPPPPPKKKSPPPPPKSKATAISITWDTSTAAAAATKTVYAGSTVTWIWGADSAYHSVQDDDKTRDLFSGYGGGSTVVTYPFMYSHVFKKAGTYSYHCGVHTGLMKGTITVLK
eukprot:TRINITY_DN284_c0_g1_i1.p1 TRINITY_DN284_c0_g1~~TRINITY_DN284_c0_g1_i1.p1  ORF type:complete len:220 (-),score=39.43 TRINITY_DN284_c0_g1_i1:1047-1706(-)